MNWYIVGVSTHSLDPYLWGQSDHPAFGPPASLSPHLASSSIIPARSVHKSRGDSVVRMCVQLKRWWVLQRGHSGDGCVLASTLCKYDLRKGDLFVLSWVREASEAGKYLFGFQRLPPARGGTAQRKIFHLANRSQLIHPGPSSSRSRFFMESSQLYAATLTHYSTEPLTTGPDYDPLLLLLALAGDVHPNPGPSRYPCSVCFKNVTSQGTSYLCTRCSHWVHSRCSGLRNAADYRKANGWICTACMTPPRPRTPSPPPSPAHMPTMSDKTFNMLLLLLFATTRSVFKSVKVSVVEIAKRTNWSHRIPP